MRITNEAHRPDREQLDDPTAMRIAPHQIASLLLVGLIFPSGASAQGYPARPVRYIQTSDAGSGADILARIVARGMSRHFGQQVIVDTRPGAGSNIGAEIAAKAAPDGYTLLQALQAHTVNVSLYPKLAYDLMRDFVPVTQLSSSPMVVVVHPLFPAKSIADLVQLAKQKPGAINYASAGVGTSTFLAGELFKGMAGVNLVEVRYRGGGAALTAAVSGEVPIYFAPIASGLPLIRQGSLRPLAVTATRRVALLPDYPTVAESGYPGYESGGWHGLMVPARTPAAIIATIHAAAVAALREPEASKRLGELGFNPVGNEAGEFAKYLRSEIDKWRNIVRQQRIAAE